MVMSSETGTWGFPKPVAFKNWLNLLILVSFEPALVGLEGEPPFDGSNVNRFWNIWKKHAFLGHFLRVKNTFLNSHGWNSKMNGQIVYILLWLSSQGAEGVSLAPERRRLALHGFRLPRPDSFRIWLLPLQTLFYWPLKWPPYWIFTRKIVK